MCKFSLASRSSIVEDGENKTDFFNCTIWGKQAETLCKYTDKGSLISIVGEINSRNYTKEGENSPRTMWEVNVSRFELLSKAEEKTKKETKGNKKLAELDPTDEDDLPF